MADDLKKNPTEQSGEKRQEQFQPDNSKKQPSRPGQNQADEDQDEQQQGGQRRVS